MTAEKNFNEVLRKNIPAKQVVKVNINSVNKKKREKFIKKKLNIYVGRRMYSLQFRGKLFDFIFSSV